MHKKRVIAYIEPERKEDLEAVSKALGKPVSRLLEEMIEQLTPQMKKLVNVSELVKQGKQDEAMRLLQDTATDAQLDLLTQVKGLSDENR